MSYSIGIDIGVASVGMAMVDENEKIFDAVSSIFEEADASSNVDRRTFRGGRRTKRRKKNRIDDFKKLWEKYGYIIPEKNEIDIVQLRNKGLKEVLSMNELYSVLLYMLKHRGISYLDDAIDDTKGSAYEKGLMLNQKSLENKLPCEIQLERLQKYGKYRGDYVVDREGESEYHSNVFTISSYVKEIETIFENQKNMGNILPEEFISEYITIFKRKREYYIGPGNELSRTDYGIYTTKLDENGKYHTDDNIFEKLIGKCSVYPEEFRASGASYTAQEFNVLNDLNNLTINNEKLTEDEKRKIVEDIKNANTVNMRTIIKKVLGEEIEQFSGARIDKSEKEIFHTFETYRKMKKNLQLIDFNIEELSREELDKIGDILTLNTEKDGIKKAFKTSQLCLDDNVIDNLIIFRKKNSTLFSKWQSLSYKAMQELIPEMYLQPKEQMQLLTEMKVGNVKNEKYKGYEYIPVEEVIKEIYNPVVVRSIRMTVKMINKSIKKYGYPDEIVIEMPRDKNTEEQKKRINKIQKENEKEYANILKKLFDEYGIEISKSDYRKQKNLPLKLKLWNEQEGRCPYSGKKIAIESLLNDSELFEIDHIIPLSISFDDSRNNKVLVYRLENQVKGNNTPYMYLNGLNREWNFDRYKNYVLDLKKRKLISERKANNLLFMQDINKIDVLKGFINRNLNDTRYASKVILNELQAFFKAKEECNTKIKVIRGSFTHQMRVNLQIEKNRDESYSHHAVDAMLIAFSQKGYEAYKKIQEACYDFETGEIINQEKWNKCIDDEEYEQVVYNSKWGKIKNEILEAEKKVKYHHRVDKKCNRSLCKQTIYGTRVKDGEIYKIYSYNIYDDKECANLIKMIKDGKETKLLMFNNDIKTYNDMVKIIKQYPNEKNPFVAYNKETGDYFRKYAKKHNGPKIEKVKYYKEKVAGCIDISHKYGYEKESKKVILGDLNPYRTDVYYNKETCVYYLIGVKYNHIKCDGNKYKIVIEKYNELLRNAGALGEDDSFEDLEKLNIEYKFTLYKNDIIRYEKNGEYFTERFLSRTMEQKKNYIETKPIDKTFFKQKNKNGEWKNKQNLVGLGKTKYVGKIVTDVLGNSYTVDKEKFSFIIEK